MHSCVCVCVNCAAIADGMFFFRSCCPTLQAMQNQEEVHAGLWHYRVLVRSYLRFSGVQMFDVVIYDNIVAHCVRAFNGLHFAHITSDPNVRLLKLNGSPVIGN